LKSNYDPFSSPHYRLITCGAGLLSQQAHSILSNSKPKKYAPGLEKVAPNDVSTVPLIQEQATPIILILEGK
jgi:hypothetical protein